MTDRLRKIAYNNKEILIIDYSDCKAEGMIEILIAAKDLVIRDNKQVLVLSIFNHKNYVTPQFLRVTEQVIREVEHLIVRNAITGISDVQRWIVKGINLWYKRQIHTFDSVDKALEFLTA